MSLIERAIGTMKKDPDIVFSPRPRRSPEEVNPKVIVMLESILDGLQAMGERLDKIETALGIATKGVIDHDKKPNRRRDIR
jgi:hypothetical protein